jgi:hypothetical protein
MLAVCPKCFGKSAPLHQLAMNNQRLSMNGRRLALTGGNGSGQSATINNWKAAPAHQQGRNPLAGQRQWRNPLVGFAASLPNLAFSASVLE